MKIVALLEHDVTGGGGFNQGLNAILQMRRLCHGRFAFEVFTTHKVNVEHLQKLGLTTKVCSFSTLDLLLSWLSSYPWWHPLQKRFKLVGAFEKRLLAEACDLVYFVTPSETPAALQRINYIVTVWDLCHRDHPEFPEIREFAEFQAREQLYGTRLAPAFAVLTDSPALAESISARYGVDRERLLPMPFAPAPFLEPSVASDKSAVLAKYALDEGYFFYPAQFWAHKNHIRVLQALALLKSRGRTEKVAFAGGDQGNRRHVESFADSSGLRDQVRFLGFVPAEDMRGLYEGCAAVVMPTYFGPTNLPPLEAWTVGKPLIYSSQFKQQAGEAAIHVDPDDANQLADAMQACSIAETRAQLIRHGTQRLREIEQERLHAEARLLSRLQQFEARRACWA